MIREYYQLAKPGIIYGNALALVAGFLLGSKNGINLWLLLATVVGTSLVIASGCVFNNYLDRGIDKNMKRTAKRALVTGVISPKNALLYAAILELAGFLLLMRFTNALTVVLGVTALVFYVGIYGFAKRHSVHGTLVGTIPGALPPVAGYTAVTNSFDVGAVLLLLILVFWQLAHFYGIAMYRAADYRAAGIPVLPVVKGPRTTKIAIMACIGAFLVAVILLAVFGYASYLYLLVTAGLGIGWFIKGLRSYHDMDDGRWGRKMFLYSLVVITGLSISISIDAILRQAVYTFYMILLAHIVVALLGLVYATYAFFVPSKSKLKVTYIMAALTLVSGTYLVVSRGSHLFEACATGLVYVAIVAFFTVMARQKLSLLGTESAR